MIVHNVLAHPIMQILNLVGAVKWANAIHKHTLPDETFKSECINVVKDCRTNLTCSTTHYQEKNPDDVCCSFEDLEETDDLNLDTRK